MAIYSGKSWFACTSIFGSLVRANTVIFARISDCARAPIGVAFFARKARLALAKEIISLIFTTDVILARILGTGPLINLAILSAVTLIAFAFVLHSCVDTLSVFARLAHGTRAFIDSACLPTETNLAFTFETGAIMNTLSSVKTRISDRTRPFVILATFAQESGWTSALVIHS